LLVGFLSLGKSGCLRAAALEVRLFKNKK